MKQNFMHLFISVFILSIVSTAKGRIHFTRLTAKEVYRALSEAGRMDAVPEGRVVTQGIAAATGFIAGIAKGAGLTSLLGLAAGGLSGLISTNTTTSGETQTQEICFSSRSEFDVNEQEARNENENEVEAKDANEEDENNYAVKPNEEEDYGIEVAKQGKQTNPQTTPSIPPPPPPPGTQTPVSPVVATTETTDNSPATTVETNNPATTAATAPTTDTTGTGTTNTNNDGTGTVSTSATETGNTGAVNCIIIQKAV